MKQIRSILAYETEWDQTEFTEQYALTQSLKLLPEVPTTLYFGFPWATLIDRLNRRESSADRLKEAINGVKHILCEQKHVVTVCQHFDMLKYRDIFKDSGITHMFWTHAVKEQCCFPDKENIKIFPFPISSIQETSYASSQGTSRNYLYSYVELNSKNSELGESSRRILANLAGYQGSLVIPAYKNSKEFFGDSRVNGKEDIRHQSVDHAAPIESDRILHKSIFSLCPSGSGPNSTRLWESIYCGSIPVVLSDNYLPPGSKALWEQATVSCPERLEDILALPDRLAKIACNEELLKRKRHAMRQLLMIYGPDCFIYDIHKLFLSFVGETVNIAKPIPQSTFSYGSLYCMGSEINRSKSMEKSLADVFILGCSSRVLFDPSGFLVRYRENYEFRTAYNQALRFCSPDHAESMERALQIKKIILANISHE